MTPQPSPIVTEAEYLAQERDSPTKHEYYDGEIFAMLGGTEAHSLIAGNVYAALHSQFRRRPCRVYNVEALQDYILIAQDDHHIEHHSRQEMGQWLLNEAVGIEATLVIPSLQCQLALEDVYEKVELVPERLHVTRDPLTE